MNEPRKPKDPEEFEGLGTQTMLETGDIELTKEICALHIRAFVDEINAVIAGLRGETDQLRCKMFALHFHLYDRPDPVNDAAMLSRGIHIRFLMALMVLAAIACFVGNTATFYLFGFPVWAVLLAALGMTGLPIVVGHLAYERIVAPNKRLQAAIVLVAVGLCFAGIYRLAEARRMMVNHIAETSAPDSYVESRPAEAPAPEPRAADDGAEAVIRSELGGAMLLIMIAADLMLGFLVGILAKLRTDEDYAAWLEMHNSGELIDRLERKIVELLATIEVVKKRCMVGILRAQNRRNKRRPPYHKVAIALAFLVLLSVVRVRAQTIERYEGILIDTSGSIQKRGSQNDLFRDYLVSTKKLLLTEPPSSRVWVSVIGRESFGGTPQVLKGWTPDTHGVFTDDLTRARHELAGKFEAKSEGISPRAAGTDIFGALWKMKTMFESESSAGKLKVIWVFSDMMNETQEFSMPGLIDLGPERMFARSRQGGLLVPLKGYKIYVCGATTGNLTPQAWATMRDFWTIYLHAAGAELASYSPECDVQR